MTSKVRSAGAFALSLLLPLVSYLTADRATLPIPERLTPNIAPAAVTRLQAYLRIRTDHGNPAYGEAAAFLNATVSALLPGASFSTHSFVPGKPVLLITLAGQDPSLPALMLNSHTDVVPVESEKWDYPPFDARLVYTHGEWRLYARGSQDMKSVGMQYLEALSALVEQGWTPTRNIHVVFVPDEEIGGKDGMGRFVKSDLFRQLNIGVALDEGLPNPEEMFNVYYGERQTWWLGITVAGSPGHGATLPPSTASQVLHGIIGKAFEFRRKEFEKYNASNGVLGDATGVNLVYLKAGNPDENSPTGFIMNMVPSTAEAGFDIRVPPMVSHHELEKEIDSWLVCSDGNRCPGVSYRWVIQVKNQRITPRDVDKNPYYELFSKGMESAGIADRLVHGIFPAATDGRYLREVGAQCFGFSPIEKTPDLLHKHNEFITMDGYMKGCKIYEELIRHLAGPLQHTKPPAKLTEPAQEPEAEKKEL